MKLKQFLSVLAIIAMFCGGGVASAATSAETLIVGGVLDLDTVTQAQWPIVFSKDSPKTVTIRGSAENTADNTHGTIRFEGDNAAAADHYNTKFSITLDNITLRSRPSAIQIVHGAVVDLIIKGKNTIRTKGFTTGSGGDGMIHVGATEKSDNGTDSTAKWSQLNIIGFDKDDRSKNTLIINEEEQTGAGIDAIRVCVFNGPIVDGKSRNKLSASHVTIEAQHVLKSNRAICCDTAEETMFDDCKMIVEGGVPIISGIATQPEGHGDLHFKNCDLNLTSTINVTFAGSRHYGAITVFGDHKVIFCDSEENSAFIHGDRNHDIGGSPYNNGVTAGTVVVSGGAIRVDSKGSKVVGSGAYGIDASNIEIVPQDPHHPDADHPSQVIFYVDRTTSATDLHVEEGMNAIVSGTSNLTDKTSPEYLDWSNGTTPNGNDGKYQIGNVVGDFNLFGTFDAADPFAPDYTIKDGEVIIVDPGNTLTIKDKTKFVIEEDGHLIIRGGGSVNNGTIELNGSYTDDEIRDIIKGWGLAGSGTISAGGKIWTNSGAMWGDLVDATDTDKKNKINNDSTPNLVVFGKNETTGDDALVAVNPKTKDEAYLVPVNQRLDLNVVITDPTDIRKVDKASANEHKLMSAAVWPLKSDGTPYEPTEIGDRVLPPLPVKQISNGTTQFSLSADEIRELREWAKTAGINEFVIWVYEAKAIDDPEYKAGGIKMPFVFKVDSPQHTLQEVVDSGKVQKEQIVEGQNLLVFDSVAQSGSVPTAEFVAINPSRDEMLADLHTVKAGNGLALDVYVAAKAGEVPIDKGSALENAQVKASLRPYDGLTPEQYRGLNDFVLTKGPHRITEGFVDFEYDYTELHRWARLHRVNEFVIYIYDVDDDGRMLANGVSREFIFRIEGVDTDIHGSHCSGCDALSGAWIAGLAGALIVSRKRSTRRR